MIVVAVVAVTVAVGVTKFYSLLGVILGQNYVWLLDAALDDLFFF